MKVIKDWRGGIPATGLEWVIFLCGLGCWVVPGIAFWTWRLNSIRYEFTDDALIYSHGLINKHRDRLYYYRMRNVASEEYLISGGKVIIEYGNHTNWTLPAIKNGDDVVDELQKHINAVKEKHHVNETNLQF